MRITILGVQFDFKIYNPRHSAESIYDTMVSAYDRGSGGMSCLTTLGQVRKLKKLLGTKNYEYETRRIGFMRHILSIKIIRPKRSAHDFSVRINRGTRSIHTREMG